MTFDNAVSVQQKAYKSCGKDGKIHTAHERNKGSVI
jgi:hypothetical protein